MWCRVEIADAVVPGKAQHLVCIGIADLAVEVADRRAAEGDLAEENPRAADFRHFHQRISPLSPVEAMTVLSRVWFNSAPSVCA